MNRSATARWEVRGAAFEYVPAFGPDSVMARMTDDALRSRVPLLDPSAVPAASHSRFQHRDLLADRLAADHKRFHAPLSEQRLREIRGGGALVIAGQQPGLLLSPAYTLLKALSAVSLVQRLNENAARNIPGGRDQQEVSRDAPFLPAFWIAGEDHDIEEVNRCRINGRKLVIPHEQLNRPGPRPPVARLSLAPWRDRIIDFAADALRDEPHRDWVLDHLVEAPFDSYTDLFAGLITGMLGERAPVLIDPMRLRAMTAPVLAHVVEHWSEVEAAFEEGADKLRSLGLDPPLDRVNLFRIDEEGRTAIDDPGQLNPDQILAEPERYSPGAALRPIVQDAILPVAATLAGPSELCYLWQIDPLYQALGVQRSFTHPRLSATCLGADVMQRAERFNLRGERILRVLRELEDYEPSENVPEDDLREIESLGGKLTARIESLMDEQTRKPLGKAKQSIEHQIGKTVQQVRQRRLERAGVGRKRLTRLADAVYPGGALQERSVSALEWLARHGPELIEVLIDRADPAANRHWLMTELGEP